MREGDTGEGVLIGADYLFLNYEVFPTIYSRSRFLKLTNLDCIRSGCFLELLYPVLNIFNATFIHRYFSHLVYNLDFANYVFANKR